MKQLSDLLQLPLNSVPLFPPAADREVWQERMRLDSNTEFAAQVLRRAEHLLNRPIPALPASLFMEFVRHGNRRHYETPYFLRRQQLTQLILAECIEYKGRFLEKMIDYLWEISCEATWSLPAHIPHSGDPLPDQPFETVDLFCAQTGMTLSMSFDLLGSELQTWSNNLYKRLHRQLLQRVVEPVEIEPFPFSWSSGVNNWTPWCCANVLCTVRRVLAGQPERQLHLVKRLCSFIERFLSLYAEDGACSEGPGYWTVSPGILVWFLEQLCQLSPQAVSLYKQIPQLKKMAEFIADAHLSGDYYANFADSPPQVNVPFAFCYRWAERLGSQKLEDFALAGMHHFKPRGRFRNISPESPVNRVLAHLFWLPGKFRSPSISEDHTAYYPETQLLFISNRHFSFAAKAGHNAEHHNHNDVGQFILMRHDLPLIVDLGAPEYTRFTFSAQRYEHILINSLGHNVPSFNGLGQKTGVEACAAQVQCRQEGKKQIFSMDLSTCYPEELQLISLKRTFVIDPEQNSLTITDCWESRRLLNLLLPIYSVGRSEINSQGMLLQNGRARIQIIPSGDFSEMSCSAFSVNDPGLLRNWKKPLRQSHFRQSERNQGSYTLLLQLP